MLVRCDFQQRRTLMADTQVARRNDAAKTLAAGLTVLSPLFALRGEPDGRVV